MTKQCQRCAIAIGFAVSLVSCSVTAPDETSSDQSVVVVDGLFEGFGTLPLGAASTVHNIAVQPDQGNNADYITAVTPTGTGCSGFVVSATGLPAYVVRMCFDPDCTSNTSQGYTFSAFFRPTALGPASCPVVISTSDPIWGTTSSVTVTLLGTGQ